MSYIVRGLMIHMWETDTVSIGELGRIITGKTPSSKETECFGALYPFITPTDLDNHTIYPKTERYISEEGRIRHRSRELPPKSVCFTCIGATIGKSSITTMRSFTNQQINGVIVDKNRHDPYFIYYLLRSQIDRIKGFAGGAATPIISKSIFSGIKIQVPSLTIQRKIAAILSAYDDLIENNTRRIKILEEMAQAIYREWFVNFRFPGHEKVKMVDSPLGKIPEGWEAKRLGDVSHNFDRYRKPLSKMQREKRKGKHPYLRVTWH